MITPEDEIVKLFERASWVWLDLDDTLIDFQANSLVAIRQTWGEFGLDRWYPDVDDWVDAYHFDNHRLWDAYSRAEVSQAHLRVHRFLDPLSRRDPSVDEASFSAMAAEMDRRYLDILAAQKALVPGAMELLGTLRARHYNIGVLSNGFKDVQYRKIETAGLADKIDLVVLSDDIGVNKPDVRLYRHAMARAGEPAPGRHLMIGDNLNTDILGAVNAGWGAIYFNAIIGDDFRVVWLQSAKLAPGHSSTNVLSIGSLNRLSTLVSRAKRP